MGRYYDNWERLVEAVMRREQFRSLSLADSISPSIRSTDSEFSFSSSSQHDNLYFRTTPSPLHKDLNLAQTVEEGTHGGKQKVPRKRRNAMWKSLSIFSGFSSKKDNGGEERKLQSSKQNYEEVSLTTEMSKRETARLRELYTLKGHIESLAKAKGVDLDSIHHYYTV